MNPLAWGTRLVSVAAVCFAGCASTRTDNPPTIPALVGANPARAVANSPAGEFASRRDDTEVVTASARTPASPQTPTPSPDAGLTLDRAIQATLLADPKLRAGFEAINQATGDAITASLKPNPTLFADGQLIPLTRPFTVDNQGGPPQSDVVLSYPIDWFLFGKRAAAMQAAGVGVKVSEADYADLVRQRVLAASTAFYDAVEAKALLELAKQDVENLERVEEVTRKAVEGGGRPSVDLSRIRLDRLRSEQALREADNAVVGSLARLRAAMGRGDADPAFDVAESLETVPSAEVLPLEEAYALAVRNRPDIASDRLKVARADADTEFERRKARAQVTPQVGYTRQFQRKAIGFPDASSYGVGVTVTLPVSDRNQGNRYRAASVLAQRNFELQGDLVDLRAEVVQAGQDLRTAAANARAIAQGQLKLAVEVRESLTKAYEAGGRPLIDVLDAQRNYRETYRLFITSRANYGRSGVKYQAALGGRPAP